MFKTSKDLFRILHVDWQLCTMVIWLWYSALKVPHSIIHNMVKYLRFYTDIWSISKIYFKMWELIKHNRNVQLQAFYCLACTLRGLSLIHAYLLTQNFATIDLWIDDCTYIVMIFQSMKSIQTGWSELSNHFSFLQNQNHRGMFSYI